MLRFLGLGVKGVELGGVARLEASQFATLHI